MLDFFVAANREEIITRCRAKVAIRSRPMPIDTEFDHGVPLFLDQLLEALHVGSDPNPEIAKSAIRHGHALLRKGFTVSQVVHDYGDVCQSITELAVEMNAPISADDFRVLNACLDDAIAGYRFLLSQGFAPEKIAIAGESSGGGLAIATLVSLR